MLVLSRKPGENIVIGSDIVITVVEVNGNRVRLGIQAPDDVRILRGELVFEMPTPPAPAVKATPAPAFVGLAQPVGVPSHS